MAATASKSDPAVEQTAKLMADDSTPMPDANTNTPPLLANTTEPKEPDQPPLLLTRKNLARLDALYGKPDTTTDSAYLFENDSDKMTISTTQSEFQQQAYENGIFDRAASRWSHRGDIGTIDECLAQRRGSIQPSERGHKAYHRGISRSHNEQRASSLMESKIFKEYCDSDDQYNRANSRPITRIPPGQDFNHNLSNPLPDLLEGLRADALPARLYDHRLHNDKDSLAFCHFAAEFKRADGNLDQAVNRAAYDGAVLVNARERALAQARADPRNSTAAAAAAIERAAGQTSVLTCVTDGRVVEVSAHYCEDGQYHQKMVAKASLLEYPNKGRELIRNAQDFARRKAYELAGVMGADLKEEEEEEWEKKEEQEDRERDNLGSFDLVR